MLYSCTHMATVGVKGFKIYSCRQHFGCTSTRLVIIMRLFIAIMINVTVSVITVVFVYYLLQSVVKFN